MYIVQITPQPQAVNLLVYVARPGGSAEDGVQIANIDLKLTDALNGRDLSIGNGALCREDAGRLRESQTITADTLPDLERQLIPILPLPLMTSAATARSIGMAIERAQRQFVR